MTGREQLILNKLTRFLFITLRNYPLSHHNAHRAVKNDGEANKRQQRSLGRTTSLATARSSGTRLSVARPRTPVRATTAIVPFLRRLGRAHRCLHQLPVLRAVASCSERRSIGPSSVDRCRRSCSSTGKLIIFPAVECERPLVIFSGAIDLAVRCRDPGSCLWWRGDLDPMPISERLVWLDMYTLREMRKFAQSEKGISDL